MGCIRAEQLADDFVTANLEAIEFVQGCSEADWELLVPGEDWTVGVVMHHVAESHQNGLRWLVAMARGDAITDTAEGIDNKNIDHATRAAAVTQDDTVLLLRENGARLEAVLRGLSDDQLERTSAFGPAGGQELPTKALAPVTARHIREHLGHARTAVRASA